MSLSLKASADGLSIELLLGATLIAKFDVDGVADGVLIASDAEAQGLTNLKKLITPEKLAKAFQGANQSLAASGYQKLPGGLIVQWGRNTSPASTTFPIAFPSAALRALAQVDLAGAASQGSGQYNIATLTTTGFTVSNPTNPIIWIAFGY